MLKKKINANLDVKEVIQDEDKIAELDETRKKVQSESEPITLSAEGCGIGSTTPSANLKVK